MRQRWWWRCRRCCWWCTIKHFAIDNIAMFVFGFEATWTWYGEIPPLMTVLATFLLFVKDAIQIVYGFMSGHSVAHNIVSWSVQFKWVQFKWDRFRGAPKTDPGRGKQLNVFFLICSLAWNGDCGWVLKCDCKCWCYFLLLLLFNFLTSSGHCGWTYGWMDGCTPFISPFWI